MSRYNFYELIREFKHIEIPALQRDYAQGRSSAEEVRNAFLSYLKKNLISGKRDGDALDYIYGSVHKTIEKLILIDGQQRMTTLFLLYWYLAAINSEQNRKEFQKELLEGESSRFSYATRPSSKEFCNNIVSVLNKIDASFFFNKTVSEALTNQKWFQTHWIKDSTVKSMLTMLDAIQKEFDGCSDNLYERLQTTFKVDFLKLDNYSSHEAGRLYIKMNSRGKPLTRFENLKAKMLTYINKKRGSSIEFNLEMLPPSYSAQDTLSGLSFSDKVGWLFDIRWTDAIWSAMTQEMRNSEKNLSESLLDKVLLNLFFIPIMNECCIQELRLCGKYNVDKSYFSGENSPLLYTSILDALDAYDRECEIIRGVINFLNGITTWDSEKKEWCLRTDLQTYEWLNFGNLKYYQLMFSDFENDQKLNLEDLLKLHSIYLFFKKYGTNPDFDKYKEWIRFSANIISASNLASDEFVNSLSSLSSLCERFDEIDHFSISRRDYPGLDFLQIEEEIEKIKLSKENPACAKEIIAQEESLYDYFKGQLRYPLMYSGLLGNHYYTPEALDKFKKVSEILYSLFVIKSTDDNSLVYNLLTRALLAKKEYMVEVGKTNGVRSFLVLNHRDYSWKRFLKDGDNSCFSELLDEIDDTDDISDSLEKVIKNCDTSSIPSWRKLIIENPRIMGTVNNLYGGEKKIWNISNSGVRNIKIYDKTEYDCQDEWVIPVKGKYLLGYQSELFSLDVYTKIEDSSPFNGVAYFMKDINDNPPSCTVLNDWKIGNHNFAIDIARKEDKEIPVTFIIRFFDRENNYIPPEIESVLTNLSFKKNEEDYDGYFKEVEWKEDGCIRFLNKLLSKLKELSLNNAK